MGQKPPFGHIVDPDDGDKSERSKTTMEAFHELGDAWDGFIGALAGHLAWALNGVTWFINYITGKKN